MQLPGLSCAEATAVRGEDGNVLRGERPADRHHSRPVAPRLVAMEAECDRCLGRSVEVVDDAVRRGPGPDLRERAWQRLAAEMREAHARQGAGLEQPSLMRQTDGR